MKFDESYWSERYRSGETGWDIGYPSTPLGAYIDQLKNKDLKILVPGCGNAYEVEHLHKSGFVNTFALDISPEAIKSFEERVPLFPKDHLICEDFFEHQGPYDLILEQTFFCALDPKQRRAYAQKCLELLHPGGKLVGLLFDDNFEKQGPPFGGSQEEYRALFGEFFTIQVMEKAHNSIGPRQGRELFIQLVKG